MHWLAHVIGNNSDAHSWPEARYSAQHYWVRPALLTDNPNTRTHRVSINHAKSTKSHLSHPNTDICQQSSSAHKRV